MHNLQMWQRATGYKLMALSLDTLGLTQDLLTNNHIQLHVSVMLSNPRIV
jgi:hypothetical protein